jgi:endonuclease/exonuclease/phosphatase family metal-dependent hydrolase
MLRRALSLSCFFLTLTTALAEDSIRIGAWNIEWLGNPNNRSGVAHGVQQKPEDIAEYIGAAEVSVLSLEEIGDNDDTDELRNTILDAAFEKLNEGGHTDWAYILFPKEGTTNQNQNVGLAWDRKKVKEVGSSIKIPIDTTSSEFHLWDRTPYATKLSLGDGKTDIVVVPLHMKSNRGGAARTRRQRQAEANRLVEAIDVVYSHFNDQDVVLLGDTNILNGHEPAAEAYRQAGYNDLNAADQPTTFHGNAPFDRIFVRAGQFEFGTADEEVIELESMPPEQHKKLLSDHYMVVTSINVMSDDDGVSNPVPFVGPRGRRVQFTGSILPLQAIASPSEIRTHSPGARGEGPNSLDEIRDLKKRIEELEGRLNTNRN